MTENCLILLWNMSFLYLDKMTSRFLLKSTSTICRLCQQRLTKSFIFVYQHQQRRNISTLLSTSSVQTSFCSLRFLSKSTKTNKKYQVCHAIILLIIIINCFQPISYGPKSKRPIIEVYHKMTVKALARAMDINVGRFFFEWVFFS
jgi:hypothetical protein